MSIVYCGIGARKTPQKYLNKMKEYGALFAKYDFILRSGAAIGADTAFEEGCDSENGKKEIFLPYKNFRGHPSSLYNIPKEAYELAKDLFLYKEKWDNIRPIVKSLLARDILQVMGKKLNINAAFVLCWTPDGCEHINKRTHDTGGTGIAIALASVLDIPVFNMKNANWEKNLRLFLKKC